MACTDCGHDCYLVDTDCLAAYTPLRGFTQAELSECYYAANNYLEGVTGSCDMCDDEVDWTAMVANKYFRAFYSMLVYKYWIELRGSGSPAKAGFSRKGGDEYSEFEISTYRDTSVRLNNMEGLLASYQKKFLVAFEEQHDACLDDETGCTCGCTQTIRCTCGYYARKRSSLDIHGISRVDDCEKDINLDFDSL